MKKSVIIASYVMSLGLFAVGCGSGEPENSTEAGLIDNLIHPKPEPVCPTADLVDPTKGFSFWVWKTQISDQMYIIQDADGNDVVTKYGLEISEEIKKAPWIIAGDSGIIRQRTCTRAFIQEGNARKYIETTPVPGSKHIIEVRPAADYWLLSGYDSDGKTTKVDLQQLKISTASRKVLASESAPSGGCNASYDAKSTESGRYILLQRLQSETCGMDQPRYNVDVNVLNTQGQKIGQPVHENMTEGSQFYWTSETVFQLKDNERTLTFTAGT